MTHSNETARQNRSPRNIRRLLKDTRGATLVEYIILVGLVALASIGAYNEFGDKVQAKIKEEGAAVEKIKDWQ